ncbi:DUF1427 family protein [Streptomyces sp. NPDC002994]|uniref:DUF1427 family protein n=1 Tax=Streptomyces sp. NPDC002994 TaxID=3154441 RepID=UPI0033B96F6B
MALAAGMLMGAVYWCLGIDSPAPSFLGLTGLLGIVIGEAVTQAARRKLTGRHGATADHRHTQEGSTP